MNDPRIEAAVSAVKNATVAWSVMASGDSMSPAAANACVEEIVAVALAAADGAATITTAEELDALPVGTVVLSDEYRYSLTYPNYTVAFQKLYDDSWHRGGRASDTHPSIIIPVRVLHFGGTK